MPVIVLVLCLLQIAPEAARAEGNIHIGQIKVHPFLTVSETFSDNIYFTSMQQVRDSFMTYMPGVKLQYPFGQHYAEAQYFAVAQRYRDNPGEDTTNHNANALVNFKFGHLFEAKLTDSFVKGHEGRAESATGFIQTYRTNSAAAAVTYHLANRSKVEFDFGKTTWDYIQRESQFRNRDENLVTSYIYYRFLPKTSAFIELDRKKAEFEFASTLNNETTALQTGLVWEISENSQGMIKGGFLHKDFVSPTLNDYRGSTATVDVKHGFSKYANLVITGKRAVNEASVAGTRYFITTGGYGEFTFMIVSKLKGIGRASYARDEYSDIIPGDTVIREDRTEMVGAGLRYSVRDSIYLEGAYRHLKRSSNIPINDYDEHAFTMLINASL